MSEQKAPKAEPQAPWRRWAVWAAALLTVALTARLGFWQLARADQKTALAAQMAKQVAGEAISAVTAATDPAQVHRSVSLAGVWLPDSTVYLDNRQMNAKPGFFVVTGLQLTTGQVVAVQRGWAPRDFVDRARLPAVQTPSGPVEVRGRLALPPSSLKSFASAEEGRIRQNIDLPQWALAAWAKSAAGSSALAVVTHVSVVQTGPASEGLVRNWLAPNLGVAKHHGYAAQWFGLSALAGVLTLWFQVLRPRRKRTD